ncbi:hypothetical protein BpHYR1_030042 [Brachionus plicatilis]|uniref:Uncharacterized protein n=1 Tax=Brachionus plicatilis TaxID=10195 RepID=A0A3M7PE49_BRAPC|nr:hypothetical protein BpHYR1_030042 [Brachionus plicatilis]
MLKRITCSIMECCFNAHNWKHPIFHLENKEAETTKCLNGNSISQKSLIMAKLSLRAPSIRDKINVFLDDTTFKLIDSLINERSYDEVKTKFRALFSRPESYAHVYLHTFVGRGQELNESLVQELDIYLRGQFLAGVNDREMAERLAVLDHENLEMLVFRAREHECLPLGFSGIREGSRNM